MTRTLTLIFAAAALAACSTPKDHFYTLIGDAPSAAPAAGAKAGPSVVIVSVSLPEAVDRTELVLRKGPNSLAVMDTRRWAESLKSAIPRVIANDLSPLLDGAAVATGDDNVGQNAKYQVRLDILRFDTTLGGAEVIDAAWVIHPASASDNAADVAGKVSLRVTARGGDYEDAVAAHSQALAQLSGEIAKQIKGLESGRN